MNAPKHHEIPPPIPEIEEQTTPEAKFEAGIHVVQKLAFDFHKMKNEMKANTAMTKELADGQLELKASLARIDLTALTEFLEAVNSMKGGIKVLGWLERPAKWLGAIIGAAAAIGTAYSFWSHK